MKINLEQSQKTILTPVMEQSIKILQMTGAELTDFLQEEMLSNPVIDLEFHDVAPSGTIKDMPYKASLTGSGSKSDGTEFAYTGDFINLEESLLMQLNENNFTDEMLRLVKYIICCLDEDGYLKNLDNNLLLKYTSQSKIDKAIAVVQSLEPAGIAGRSLCEVLELQLKRQGKYTDLWAEILHSYLPDLSRGKFAFAAKELGVSQKKVEELYEYIKTLNPRPGQEFAEGDAPIYISPDIAITKTSENTLAVTLCSFSYPTINVSSYYSSLLKQSDDAPLKEYINDKIAKASLLVSCLETRNSTLLRVAEIIAEKQRDFFLAHNNFLCVLKLQDVAHILDMHQSTVSRAIKNKYLICDFGVFPLKYFFARGISEDETDTAASSSRAKNLISELVEKEDKHRPLSDSAIEKLLSDSGITLSRRCVAKYREELGLASSTVRKR